MRTIQTTRTGAKNLLRNLALVPLLFCLAADGAAPRPNVILVLTDDQGYGDLACHGNPWIKTPNLDRLYAQSLRLTEFHVSPLCTPTRGALMTGQSPLRNGAWGTTWGRSIPRAGLKTVADLFAENGYATGMFGKWHLGDSYPYRPIDRGFQYAVRIKGGSVGQTPDYWGNDCFDDTYFVNDIPRKFSGYCTDIWFNEAMRFAERSKKAGKPFFIYLATNAPHDPLKAPQRFIDLYRDNPQVPNAKFYAMISSIDENMGRLMAWMERQKLDRNTILIFTTDNGTAHGLDNGRGFAAGMRGHKGTYTEGGHRVPFFIRWPDAGMQGGRDLGETCAVEDLLPTLADLCGLPLDVDQKLDGIDLAPLLRGETARLPNRVFALQFRQSHTPPKKWMGVVVDGNWRLLWGNTLYNVADDPLEKTNVIGEHPEVAARLRAWYEKNWQSVQPQFSHFSPIWIGADKQPEVRLDAMDWACDKSAWDQWQVRPGLRANGPWHVRVVRDGTYRFALRRWPREVNVPITGTFGPPYNKAIALTDATIEIQGVKRTRPIKPNDRESVFEIPLKKGTTTLLTTFSNRKTGDSLGAYYVYAQRIEDKGVSP